MTSRIHLPRNLGTAGLPHYSGALSSSRAMWFMSSALLPLALWGTLLFGLRAPVLIALSVLSALAFEALAALLSAAPGSRAANMRRQLGNGSAVLTGLLGGLMLPVGAHWAVPLLMNAFAILLVKWGFGGLGGNWLNPALAGRVFIQLSWPASLTTGSWGRSLIASLGWNIDGISAASDLALIRNRLEVVGSGNYFRPLSLLGREFSNADSFLTRFLNEQLLVPNGTILPEGYIDYFLGFRYGAIGETSALLILLVSVLLFARGIISWRIPLAGALGMALFTWLFGGTAWGAQAGTGDVLFALLSGGFLFTLFFMAGDPVTTPYSQNGQLLFGLGFGLLSAILREFSLMADASALAVLCMNSLTGPINSLTRKRPFGLVPERMTAHE